MTQYNTKRENGARKSREEAYKPTGETQTNELGVLDTNHYQHQHQHKSTTIGRCLFLATFIVTLGFQAIYSTPPNSKSCTVTSHRTKMSFKLEEVNADADFKELIACEWESYENPFQTFFRLFCPIRGSGSHAREESLTECTQRQLEWHVSDPSSYWQKVSDTTTGKNHRWCTLENSSYQPI